MIDYKSSIFHVQDLHHILVAVHEDENSTITDILVHQ